MFYLFHSYRHSIYIFKNLLPIKKKEVTTFSFYTISDFKSIKQSRYIVRIVLFALASLMKNALI